MSDNPAFNAPPCSCIKARMKDGTAVDVKSVAYVPPILDPFCPAVASHRAAAVLGYEPTYDAKPGYAP